MSKSLKIAKAFTYAGQIDHILQAVSPEQLKTFVREKALIDADFREIFLIYFADLRSNGDPAEAKYKQLLNDIIKRYQTKEGIITSSSADSLTQAIHQLLQGAHKATTPSRETIDLCLAVISTLPKLIDLMEDSENRTYNLLSTTCTILWECYSTISIERQQYLFERILHEYSHPLYVELDMDGFLLALLKDWSKGKPERQAACLHQLENLLKQTQADQWRKNYLLEQTKALIAYWTR